MLCKVVLNKHPKYLGIEFHHGNCLGHKFFSDFGPDFWAFCFRSSIWTVYCVTIVWPLLITSNWCLIGSFRRSTSFRSEWGVYRTLSDFAIFLSVRIFHLSVFRTFAFRLFHCSTVNGKRFSRHSWWEYTC